MLKKLLVILVVVLAVSSVAVFPAKATGDLAVEFQMTPLFSNLNFVPGNLETRWIKVTNNSVMTQKVIIGASAEIDLNHLANVINLTVKENGATLYAGTLAKFFNAEETYLSDLAFGATKQYDFTISFDNAAGNQYQGKTMNFTLNIGFLSGGQDSDSSKPIVKAKWEMIDDGLDEALDAGAQFLPSGQYQVGKTIKVCAIVSDPDGANDINSVYGEVFYPPDIALGLNHEADRQGCGQLAGDKFNLQKLSQNAGYELFCNTIKNSNNNLVTFNSVLVPYTYEEICAQDGELKQETADVYCGEKTLSYEDPSGDYRALITTQDTSGLVGILENKFEYLTLTAFETDFANILYGSVRLNNTKIINGDLVWGNSLASIRNIGNTRLFIKIKQDDMGLGQTDSVWNVSYGARLGDLVGYKNYWPEIATILDNPLNLSETNKIDFSINIFKFPSIHEGSGYFGSVILSAEKAPHLTCNQ
ncbi:MAG: hypothetical protein Q7K65_03735 [Candidatus Buchananbacteria bacterium]|nr:hypothetical protein [Candidatus Buchananbacteria bacterium]